MTAPTPASLLDEADRAYRAGHLDAAHAKAVQACALFPSHANAWLLRADIARARADLNDLQVALGRAASLTGDPALRAMLQVDRGWALFRTGHTGQAMELARALPPHQVPKPHLAPFGGLLDAVGLSDAAEAPLRQAVEHRPDDPGGWYNLALVHRALGRVEALVGACERAIALAPDLAAAHALLASARTWSGGDNHVPRLRQALTRTADPLDRARLGYALFKELDDLKQVDAAWGALEPAAQAARSVFPWSAEGERRAWRAVNGLCAGAPAPADRRSVEDDGAPRALFVVGLPRSGTTLVDRVFAAHSQVRSLGELNAFAQLADRGQGPPGLGYVDPAAIERMRDADWPAVGRAYRAEAGLMSGGRPVVTDKNPQNWVFADLIAKALPDAVIVHVSRSPMDSLFGAYKQLFIREHAWSYSQADIAGHYAGYLAEAGKRRARLGGRWVDVAYEDLARFPDVAIPALLAACDLPFEPACLQPQLAAGAVRTISSLQVREAINTRSIGSWRPYARQLEPLRADLQARGVVDGEGEAIAHR